MAEQEVEEEKPNPANFQAQLMKALSKRLGKQESILESNREDDE